LNLFDEANGKAQKVIAEMERLARGGSENMAPAGGCVVLLFAICSLTLMGVYTTGLI
jgi:hypothetical protein